MADFQWRTQSAARCIIQLLSLSTPLGCALHMHAPYYAMQNEHKKQDMRSSSVIMLSSEEGTAPPSILIYGVCQHARACAEQLSDLLHIPLPDRNSIQSCDSVQIGTLLMLGQWTSILPAYLPSALIVRQCRPWSKYDRPLCMLSTSLAQNPAASCLTNFAWVPCAKATPQQLRIIRHQ